MRNVVLISALVLAWSSGLGPAAAQGDRDLQFPRGVLDVEEPIAPAGPIVLRLERIELLADLGPGAGARAPLDRLLLVARLGGEIDRLLGSSSVPFPIRLAALPPGALPPDDRPILPLPPHGRPLIPGALLPEWLQRIEEALSIELPEPDNPGGTYWPHRLYTVKVEGTLDHTDARETLQRLEQACEPFTGWRPDPSVDWNTFPLMVRGPGADPIYVERASADGRRFRIGFGLFLREDDARRLATSISSCLGRSLGVAAIQNEGRNLALVHGSRVRIP